MEIKMTLYHKLNQVTCEYKIDLRDYEFEFKMYEYLNIERLIIKCGINPLWLSDIPNHYDGPMAGSLILGTNEKDEYDKMLIIIDDAYTNLITEKLCRA